MEYFTGDTLCFVSKHVQLNMLAITRINFFHPQDILDGFLFWCEGYLSNTRVANRHSRSYIDFPFFLDCCCACM